jgi:hypothetical protein
MTWLHIVGGYIAINIAFVGVCYAWSWWRARHAEDGDER